MNILLPALAVAYAAFCVWLTVRIVNLRDRWAKWTLSAIVGLPTLYVLSFGPACWITSRIKAGQSAIPVFYGPLTWAMSSHSDTAINRVSAWYAKIGAPDDWQWGALLDEDGRHIGWIWDDSDPNSEL